MHLCPAASYFPGFLTPAFGDAGLDIALGHVMAPPRHRLLAELTRPYHRTRTPVPRAVRLLAQGRPEAPARLGRRVRDYYAVAVEPYTAAIRAEAAVDRAARAEAVLHRGPRACSPDSALCTAGATRAAPRAPRTRWIANCALAEGF
ncbi:hypothetical protein ACFSL4_32715 [Streptomyces caeni]|uniref:Uncharacterized protein n=1 Tax=Streptomyces caeni TaxID=2307231 RepID=A0ABW4IZK1_9ACTN